MRLTMIDFTAVKQYVQENKIDYHDISEKSGYSHTTVCKVLNNGSVKVDSAEAVLNALGFSLEIVKDGRVY